MTFSSNHCLIQFVSGAIYSLKHTQNLILTILYMIKLMKILTAALQRIIDQCLIHSFKLLTIFEDITSGSSEVVHSSLKALKLQGPSKLLLLWQDD